MSTRHPVVRYSRVAVLLHWVLGFALIAIFGVGLYMADLPFSPQRLKLYNWHKWAGVSILLLSAMRLAWRLTHRPPPLVATLSAAQRTLAHAGHALLYALMVVIPLTGWLMSSAKGVQTVWFGVWPIPDLLGRDKALGELLQLVHAQLNTVLMLALAGHVAAALWHHLVLKDDTLRRMR